MPDRPNILIIMSDEHAPQFSSVHGHALVQSPNMERLAGMGVTFDNAYCNSPICGPSRMSLLKLTDRSARESDVKIAGEGLTHGGSGTDFDWNSDYWRGFGAPWGGMLTTVEEMTRLLLLFRNGGAIDNQRILSARSAAMMVEDHTSTLPDLDDTDRRGQRWGLGWRLSGRQAGMFGDLASRESFGHGGATGTLAWVDPAEDVTCVIFTNDPDAAGSLRGRISNLVLSALP